jgi:[NiFe] hydrogenase assembly HybE family chaperone
MRIHTFDPSALVEAAFSRIEAERMAGLPVLNPALRVQAVDFQPWQGHWLGMLVTPWSMGLMLLPGNEEGWQSVAENRRRPVNFPAGDFNFLGGTEDEIGEYQTCPLFAAMAQFADQQQAVATARLSLAALLQPPAAAPAEREPDQPSASRRRFLTLGR